MTLFADGFVGYSVMPESARPPRQAALGLLAHHEQLIRRCEWGPVSSQPASVLD